MKDEEILKDDPVARILNESLGNLKNIIDVDTVMGDPVGLEDGSIIIPITKVSVGFVAGGGEYVDCTKKKRTSSYPFSGGSGAGFSVKPIGFLVGKNGDFKMVTIYEEPAYQKLADIASELAKTYLKSQAKTASENKKSQNEQGQE